MKIIVTGGAGFIGSNIVDALIKEGHEVAVVDNLSTGREENVNASAQFFNADITDAEALENVFEDFRPEVIFHAAAQIDVRKSVDDPAFDAETNVIGSVNLFKLAVNYGVRRIVYSSTGGALYGEPKTLPAAEETPIEPLSPYGVSKYCVENYLNYFQRLYGLERIILRYANVYGPRQDPLGEAGVVAIFTGKILKGEKPVIYGDGTQTRDYVYVDDVVRANLIAIAGKEGIYNIGTGIETSVNELVSIFAKVLQAEISPQYTQARKGEVHRISLDGELAKKELGFAPKVSIEEGLKKTIEWYKRK
jgi:UDP-glucose 4-epimerase